MHTPSSHSHCYVDVDVDPCSFLAFEATGEDSDAAASRGNSEARRIAYQKGRLLR